MEEYLPLIRSPHFVIFIVIEIVTIIGMTRLGIATKAASAGLTQDDRAEFERKYGSPDKRYDMPERFRDYAEALDKNKRKIFLYLGLSSIGFLILLFRLLELYAL